MTSTTSTSNPASSSATRPELVMRGGQVETLIPDGSAAQSPDRIPQLCVKGIMCYAQGAIKVAFGVWTVMANHAVRSKLNQSANDFLQHHCFSNMTSAERAEYFELTSYMPVYCAQVAVATTAFFIADGGLCQLFNVGKSIYDRACSYFARPDSRENQTGDV